MRHTDAAVRLVSLLHVLDSLEICRACGVAVGSHVVPCSASCFSNVRQRQHILRKSFVDIVVVMLCDVIIDPTPEFALGHAPAIFNAHPSHFWVIL